MCASVCAQVRRRLPHQTGVLRLFSRNPFNHRRSNDRDNDRNRTGRSGRSNGRNNDRSNGRNNDRNRGSPRNRSTRAGPDQGGQNSDSIHSDNSDGTLFGFDSVRSCLMANQRNLSNATLLVSDVAVNKRRKQWNELKKQMHKLQLQWAYAGRRELDEHMLFDSPHNGFILKDVGSLPVNVIATFDDAEKLVGEQKLYVWVLADRVLDPQNLGAIARSSAFFGASGVMVSAKNSAPLSPIVSKTSAGAIEWLPVVRPAGVVEFLKQQMSERQDIEVLGMSLQSDSVSVRDYKPKETTRHVVLVASNEHDGLRDAMPCTSHVTIPQAAHRSAELAHYGVDSLNVSNAVAVVLSHLLV
ncbi:MAG: hypothetical protein MHM6MM_002627 [Cercozoa sp. M6MM]